MSSVAHDYASSVIEGRLTGGFQSKHQDPNQYGIKDTASSKEYSVMTDHHPDHDASAEVQSPTIQQGSMPDSTSTGTPTLAQPESQSACLIRSQGTAQQQDRHLQAPPQLATLPVHREIDDSAAQLNLRLPGPVQTGTSVAPSDDDGSSHKLDAPSAIASQSTSTVPAKDIAAHPGRIPRLSINPQAHRNGAIAGASSALRRTGSAGVMPVQTPSVKATLSPATTATLESSSTPPSSTLSSPLLGPMAEITPLPSPIVPGGSPGPWGRKTATADTAAMTETPSPTNDAPTATPTKSPETRKPYRGLLPAANESRASHKANHSRDRSISDYTTEAIHITRPRIVTVSGPGDAPDGIPSSDSSLKREEHLAERRGITTQAPHLPSPPHSDQASDSDAAAGVDDGQPVSDALKPLHEYFEAISLRDSTRRRWRALRLLGQGTFSKVVLAVADDHGAKQDGTMNGEGDRAPNGAVRANGETTDIDEGALKPSQLVAVKIVEHGPAGGASEQRVESSLKRELEIMQSIDHPSLVHLEAFSIEPTRALLFLSYYPGGDLFDFASQRRALLSPALIRRIFAELVMATLYLHEQLIVHRDIKLENVLMNLRVDEMRDVTNWQTYPYSVVTLTDLGLSRRIEAADPKLHTRCGSEDYASPELLMGQAYDGRQTDGWALGVVLYALMEARLPFDPPPGATEQQRQRTRTVHRIARCDWRWCKYANDDDDGEPGDFGELEPARHIVEGLLKRASRRLALEMVGKDAWVKEAVTVEGGIRGRDQEV